MRKNIKRIKREKVDDDKSENNNNGSNNDCIIFTETQSHTHTQNESEVWPIEKENDRNGFREKEESRKKKKITSNKNNEQKQQKHNLIPIVFPLYPLASFRRINKYMKPNKSIWIVALACVLPSMCVYYEHREKE